MLLRTEIDPCIESHSTHAAFPMHTLPRDSSHSASSPTMRVTRPAGRGLVRPHGSASTNANSDAPSLLMTCVDSQPGSRWSRGTADDEPQGSRERIAMKDRTGLTQCGWSASVPVWASRKEATSVEAVGTAIQSSSQRDRVRVTTARDVGRIRPTGASRRARGSKTIPASTRVTSMSAGAEHGRYVKSATPLHTRTISMPTRACNAICRPKRSAGSGACLPSGDRLNTLSAETPRTFASNDAIELRVFEGRAAGVP